MDEQENAVEDELNLDTETDEVADTEATDTDEQETETSDEQEQDTLELGDEPEEKPVKGKAETAKAKLVSDWAKNVKGELKSLDDIPADQAWLIPLVEAELGKTTESQDDVIERKLNEREANRRFDSMKGELNSLDITKEQKSTLEGKYKTLRGKGLSKLESLELAMEIAGVDPEEMSLDAKRYAARMRTPGSYKKGETDPIEMEKVAGFGAVVKSLPKDKVWEGMKASLRN